MRDIPLSWKEKCRLQNSDEDDEHICIAEFHSYWTRKFIACSSLEDHIKVRSGIAIYICGSLTALHSHAY